MLLKDIAVTLMQCIVRKATATANLLKGSRNVGELSTVSLEAREEILNEREEEWHILGDKFAHVHITKRPHHQEDLRPA